MRDVPEAVKTLEKQWPHMQPGDKPVQVKKEVVAEEEIVEEEIVEEEIVEEEEEGIVEEEEEEEEIVEDPDKPPGFKSFEEWVAEGNDPKKFRGEDAYSEDFKRKKQHHSDIAVLKDSMKDVVSGMDAWKQEQINIIRVELQGKLNNAKENNDIEGALEIQDRLNNLDNIPEKKAEPAKQHPFIAEFMANNPIVDKNNPRFDVEFYDDMVSFQAKLVNDLTSGIEGSTLTDAQVEKTMKLAYEKAKALNPNLFKSPRKMRQKQTTPKGKKRASTQAVDPKSRLKSIKIERTNKRDTDVVNEMYDAILKTSGKAAAERFALNMTEQ